MAKGFEQFEIEIDLRGPYDLREVALMGFGHRDEKTYDGVMRLAFCVDDAYETPVGVELRQEGQRLVGVVHQVAGGVVDAHRVRAQVARTVSADHDGEAYAQICRADPVLEPTWSVAPGFRPALFYSPYEAAVWSVLSARRGRFQGIRVRERLSVDHGTTFELAGRRTAALPGAARLAGIDDIPGLPADRIPRLHAIAEAARDGRLGVERLQAMTPEEAMAELQRLPGIGPFYSSLVVIRGLGLADVLPDEPKVRAVVDEAYGRAVTDAEFVALAESWRPYRTWVAVMLRALSGRTGGS